MGDAVTIVPGKRWANPLVILHYGPDPGWTRAPIKLNRPLSVLRVARVLRPEML